MTQTLTRDRTSAAVQRPEPRGRVATIVLLTLAIGVALPIVSSALGLYDRVEHWGKLVHGLDGFCATLVFGQLFLGWRQQAHVELADELAALMTMFFGVLVGLIWEIVEFIRDWVAYSDLQKSNTDTMTDFLANDVAVVVAALLAMHVYCRILGRSERAWLGTTAEWLVDGPSRLLERHGFALTIVMAVVIATSIALLWFAGRPVPGIPIP